MCVLGNGLLDPFSRDWISLNESFTFMVAQGLPVKCRLIGDRLTIYKPTLHIRTSSA